MSLADKVRHVRESRGLTKCAAARLVGVSATYWDKIEKGDSIPTINVAARISKILNLPAEVIFQSVEDEVLTAEELDTAIEKRIRVLFAAHPDFRTDPFIGFARRWKYRERKEFLQFLEALQKILEKPKEKGGKKEKPS